MISGKRWHCPRVWPTNCTRWRAMYPLPHWGATDGRYSLVPRPTWEVSRGTRLQQIQLNETLQPEMQKAADFFFPRQGFLFGHIRQQWALFLQHCGIITVWPKHACLGSIMTMILHQQIYCYGYGIGHKNMFAARSKTMLDVVILLLLIKNVVK